MPSNTRITIISNANQSRRAPLLLPSSSVSLDPKEKNSCRTRIIEAAQSKLRLKKKPTRIFVPGGHELASRQDWELYCKNDAEFLVSLGEEYVGSSGGGSSSTNLEGKFQRQLVVGTTTTTTTSTHDDGGSDGEKSACSMEVLAEDVAELDQTALSQFETTARSLPGIVHAVAQPDLHPGTKFPIGAVFVSQGWIHPPLIGGDIGCGMAWYRCRLTRAQIQGDKGRKVAEKLRGLEGPWRTQKDREVWLSADDNDDDDDDNATATATATYSAGAKWDAALGTIGAGNHFAELQVVEDALSSTETAAATAPACPLYQDETLLLVHSGSRGFGSDILKSVTADGGQTSMRDDDPKAKAYLQQHDRACKWASRNRDLIALRFLACLEPGDEAWELGASNALAAVAPPARIHAARESVQRRKVVDIWHNSMEKTAWPPQPPPSPPPSPHSLCDSPPPAGADSQAAYIHRKGAAPVYDPRTRQPLRILPLPGSRATPTLILHPLLTSENGWGLQNALSLAHGAGRAMSRAKAADYVRKKYRGQEDQLLRGDVVRPEPKRDKKSKSAGGPEDVFGGTWVICEDKGLVWEEAPEAYKDVWEVGGDLVAKGVAERWGWCRAKVSYKIRNE
ncbi:MAG: hypothetical protein LQ351_002911 [Letrouitia transgressa]|nr:MAG: hypothetical protein LQ351_002911 [Letrouitia transgressa]